VQSNGNCNLDEMMEGFNLISRRGAENSEIILLCALCVPARECVFERGTKFKGQSAK